MPDKNAPETILELTTDLVSTAGNILLKWSGHDRWNDTLPQDMRYQWRMDQGNWSSWSNQADFTFTALSPGKHAFEVRTMDRDANVDLSPAVHAFVVEAPWWRNPWVAGGALVLLTLVGVQTGRVIRRDRRLVVANRELSEANREIREQTERKSRFLASMSHDLRTPMNAIIGYTRILLRRSKDALEPRQYRNLENIETSSQNLLSLINDILDLSKIEAGRIDLEPEAVDLKQLATECIASVESLVKSEVQLKRQLEDVNPVHTDADRIRRVVMNLLSNALKFTEQGSIILSLKPVDGWIELSVADTGMGIPPEDLPHIFDEFRQVEGGKAQEGTGLGLSIAKKSMELLGGTIEAESEVGKGTVFTVRIVDYESAL